MSNKSSGNAFEHDLAQYMSRRGWWAHIFQDNRNGQPFDIVLAKDGKTQEGVRGRCVPLKPYGTESDQCYDILDGMWQ